MSFGGHVLDMIKRNNQNQALREKHRKNFKKLYSRSLKNNEGYRTLVKKVVIPEKELQEFKE